MLKCVSFLLFTCVCISAPLHAADGIASYQDFIQWVLAQQATFHRELVTLVRSISREGSPALLWGLISTSFFYGVFHAAGPGHGKAVISAYMLASKAPLRRGIGLAFLCAGVQAVMAVLIILVLSQVFSLAGKAMKISQFFEAASFAAVGLIGLWMLMRLLRGKSSCGHDHTDHLGHTDSCCNHAHHDDAQADEAHTARRGIWAMVAAVGIRPCTGAVLVLLFSLSANIFIWGLVATFAMALGTAITVATLAAVSVFVRDTGFALSDEHQVWRQRVTRSFGFVAALALIVISVSMIWSYISNAGRAF
ncbi:nickel/cobalt transporter [Marinomonas algarum]|uniref:Nickel/cobalt efflux system n=1 Tax=Marinomonas algarum TaxID=2883105 RepID=A0A9X1LCJ7_9GAMM|nr:nickel/cobalt transporter [Marinomonas algarum]MCB5162134.1 nickel/cobalt transporter [Marinomonas algarum]